MPRDEKFKLIAHKTKTSELTVLGLWNWLLDYASQQETRGNIENFDPEAFDVHYNLEDGTAQKIIEEMKRRNMIDGEYIQNWERFQVSDKEKARLRQQKHRARAKEKLASECHEKRDTCHEKRDTCHEKRDTCHEKRDVSRDSNVTCHTDKIRLDKTRDNNINNNIYTTATDVVVEKGGVGENKTDASASYCGDYCGGDEEQEPRLELRADNPSPSKGKVLTLTMPLSREVVEIPIKRSHVPYEDMQRLYNTVVAAENGAGNSPTRCLRLDDKRRKVLAKAWNETPYMPWFEEYARMVRDSCPFLMGKEAGRNGRFFKLDIAQFFRSDIITKALEGKYRTRYDGALTLEQVFDIWNEKLAPRGFDRAVILGTETERRDKLRTILDEFDNTVAAVGGAEKFFRALCDVATADPWCCGENKQQRKITVNFFLEPRSVARLIQTSLS